MMNAANDSPSTAGTGGGAGAGDDGGPIRLDPNTIMAYCLGDLDSETTRRVAEAAAASFEVMEEIVRTRMGLEAFDDYERVMLDTDPREGDELFVALFGSGWYAPHAGLAVAARDRDDAPLEPTREMVRGWTILITPEPDGRLAAYVEDGGGDPVANAQIRLEDVPVTGRARMLSEARTDAEGRAALGEAAAIEPAVGARFYRVVVTAPGTPDTP